MEITFKSDWVVASATIPSVGAPTNFTATPISEDTIRLAWEPSAEANTYELEFAKNQDFSDTRQIYSGPQVESFDHSELERGVPYYYRVRGVKVVQ